MEIPKNTTQIGEIQGNHKIFIEDYVISYIKQLCRQEPDCKKRIALYGVMRTEQEQQYYFIYGGSRINIHGKNDYYLTTQDYEEITWAGEKYFDTYVSLGFVTIEDELPEGIFLFCDRKEKYVKGYHIFYEKNDSMLTFLINRQNEIEGETKDNQLINEQSLNNQKEEALIDVHIEEPVMRERTKTLRSREELLHDKKSDTSIGEIKLFGVVKSVAAALLIVLCVTAISTMNGLGKIENVQNYFQKAFGEIKEKKIPDKEDVVPTSNPLVPVTSVSDNNTVSDNEVEEDITVSESVPEEVNTVSESVSEEVNTVSESVLETVKEQTEVSEPQSYIIREGETLISISKTFYGDDSKVKTICELNGITNSDNIQVGQKIILP